MSDFNPQQFLTQLSGKDYLEVKWRLLWLRTADPDAIVETTLITDQFVTLANRNGQEYTTREAVFQARITLTSGGSATGYGSETAADFGDYREKAETKAIGRALGALGFGTQFTAGEFDGEAQAQRPVDAPLQVPSMRPQNRPVQAGQSVGTARYPQEGGTRASGPANAPQTGSGATTQTIQNPDAPASQKQKDWASDLIRKKGEDPALYLIDGRITKGEASAFISGIGNNADNWPAATGAQLDEIAALLIQNGHDDDDFDTTDISSKQAAQFIAALRQGRLPELLAAQAGMVG